MRALVVYESMFGNTRDVARSVGEGIATVMPVEIVEVAGAPARIPDDVTLLVVGGPTHAHGMTNPDTRADAGRRAGERLVSRGAGIREWLASVGAGPAAVSAAAFDTRIKGPRLLWGSAARAADAELRRLGLRIVAPPECFLIDGPTGPAFDRVLAGELDRARDWGRRIAPSVPSAR